MRALAPMSHVRIGQQLRGYRHPATASAMADSASALVTTRIAMRGAAGARGAALAKS
jgi:hypothetical protein